MWPPTEIPRMLTENTRFSTRTGSSPLCHIGMPRARATTISAPNTPKIAPDAPDREGVRLEQERPE